MDTQNQQIAALPPKRRPTIGQAFKVTLPISGDVVRARRVSTQELARAGTVPADLTSMVWDLYGNQDRDFNRVMADPKGLLQFANITAALLPLILISPQVGERTELEYGDDGVLTGTLSLADLQDLDRNHLFMFGIGVFRGDDESPVGRVTGDDMRSFRDESARAASGSDRETVRPAPVGDVGPRADGPGSARSGPGTGDERAA